MRRLRTPHLAPAIFSAVIVLAVAALAWGVTHGKSQGDGYGSAKDQAAARTALTALQLPPGFVRDPTFTACGSIVDACLTSKANTAETLTALTTIVHAVGGSLPDTCSVTITSTDPTAGPRFTCAVQGRLHGAQVLFSLGDGWAFPGDATLRTAVIARVATGPTPPAASPLDPKPGSAADAAALLPAAWASAPQSCAGGSAPPASAPASSSPASSATSPSTPLLITTPPLPACAATAITDNVSVRLALADAAAQISKLALDKGFRLDGHPCLAGSTSTSCVVRGERISSGVQQVFVATLTDDGRGDMVGTLAVTRQTETK
jgi:hypothetical protein